MQEPGGSIETEFAEIGIDKVVKYFLSTSLPAVPSQLPYLLGCPRMKYFNVM